MIVLLRLECRAEILIGALEGHSVSAGAMGEI